MMRIRLTYLSRRFLGEGASLGPRETGEMRRCSRRLLQRERTGSRSTCVIPGASEVPSFPGKTSLLLLLPRKFLY